MADTNIDDRLNEAIDEPKSVTVDGELTSQHSLSELIAAAKYLKSQNAAKKSHRGLRFTKIVPPGAQ